MKKKSLINTIVNAPYTVWAAMFIIVPLIIVAYYAFTDKNGAFTFENIIKLTDYSGVFGAWFEFGSIIIDSLT